VSRPIDFSSKCPACHAGSLTNTVCGKRRQANSRAHARVRAIHDAAARRQTPPVGRRGSQSTRLATWQLAWYRRGGRFLAVLDLLCLRATFCLGVRGQKRTRPLPCVASAIVKRPRACERSPQLFEQCLGFLQIQRVKALGEPAIDRGEKIVGLLSFALIAPQTSHAHCRAELKRFRLLLPSDL
jgi:hypothetical protein